MRRASALVGGVLLAALSSPATAQMAGMAMPGMKMPVAHPSPPLPPRKKASAKPAPTHSAPRSSAPPADVPAQPALSPMPGLNHGPMESMSDHGAMQGMAMPQADASGTALPAGHAPAPPIPADHYADRQFPKADMDRARAQMLAEQGAQFLHRILFNLAELQTHQGYRWDGEAWFGGDINRAIVKSEGDGGFHRGVESAEVQALYSRAISPTFNLQAGVRQDIEPSTRTYVAIGVEGLAPYDFETEAVLFLSSRGDLLARLEAWYDQRITQRIVLQPRAELNFAAQDVRESRIGAGLSEAELGLRLRYEIDPAFAPYVGLSYQRQLGLGATLAHAAGENAGATRLVAGVRTWF